MPKGYFEIRLAQPSMTFRYIVYVRKTGVAIAGFTDRADAQEYIDNRTEE